ncbi:MAG: hypothetical protein HS122_00930 [Opitutaceae bacterium]|nr:hypothetical protein [Opitutaceae bacterium]
MREAIDQLPWLGKSVLAKALFLILVVGLYFAINRVFGKQRELGKRVILFLGGGAFTIMGVFLFLYAFSIIYTKGLKAMTISLLASVFVLCGLWLVIVSLFASNGYVSNVLYDFLRGL